MSSPLLSRSKMRKRPPSKRKTTVRPFIIPVTKNVPKTAESSPDLEAEDLEAVLGSSADGSAAASPAKRRRGQPREGTQSPAKQAGPKLAPKRLSSPASLERGQAGPSRSASKGDSSPRHSGRGRDSFTLPRSEASPQGGEEEASGQGDRPQTKSPAAPEALGDEKSLHRRSKLLPRRALDFDAALDESEAPPTTKETPPRALRSSTSPPANVESPLLRRMSTKKPYQGGNVTSFEPRIHSTPLVPSRKAPAGKASAPLVEYLDSSESGTSKSGGRPAPGRKRVEPPVFGDLPTTRHAQRSLLEMLRRGGKERDASPRASVKRPSPENRGSSSSKTERVPANRGRPGFLARDDFVECPVEEEEEEEEEEAREDKEGATSAAALRSYKEMLSSGRDKHSGSASGSLPKRGRPKEPKSGASGSSELPAPSSGHGAQDAADWDLPSTSRGHRSSPQVATTSQDGADKATKALKKKKKLYVAVQLYQPKGVERSKCQATAFDVFLTLAMEVIDEEIEQCQSEEGKRVLEMYKQNIIKETCKIIEELNVYTIRLPELEKEKRKLRALRKSIEELEEKIVRCVRENGLEIDPYQFLLDEEDMRTVQGLS